MSFKNVIGEASAAIVSYVYRDKYINQNVLVFDLGGATLDISVAKIECLQEKEIIFKKSQLLV